MDSQEQAPAISQQAVADREARELPNSTQARVRQARVRRAGRARTTLREAGGVRVQVPAESADFPIQNYANPKTGVPNTTPNYHPDKLRHHLPLYGNH
jgi:hypothetical protein